LARRGVRRRFGIATVLFLCTALAQAGEEPSQIPLFAGSDGSRAWVEVSHSGNRAKAVPTLEIPGETVRQVATVGEAGNGLLAPPPLGEEKERKGRIDVGDFLKRHKSLVVREGPEGVSLGNAFDLVGNIRDARKKGRGNREKLEAIVGTVKRGSAGGEPVPGMAESGERSVASVSGKSGLPSADRVRSRLENR
jgi:hypothetical protein